MAEKRVPADFVPLNIMSKYAGVEKKAAVSPPEELATVLKEKGYRHFALTDPHLIATGFQYVAAGENNLLPVPGIRASVSPDFGHPIPALLIPRNQTGFSRLAAWDREFSSLTPKEKAKKTITPNDIEKAKGDIITIFLEHATGVEDLLRQEGVYVGIEDPAHMNRVLRLSRHNPEAQFVVAHAIRMGRAEEKDMLEWLAKAWKADNADILNHPNHQYAIPMQQDIWDWYWQSIPAIGRTKDIAESVAVSLPEFVDVIPKIVTKGYTPEEYLAEQAKQIVKDYPLLEQRVTDELESIVSKPFFASTILIGLEIALFCNHFNIPMNTTGSANNSVLLALLGINQLNPYLVNDFDFKRFINKERTDLPDIDIELPYDQVERVQNFLSSRYPGKVARLRQIHHIREDGLENLSNKSENPLPEDLRQRLLSAEIPFQIPSHQTAVALMDDPYPMSKHEAEKIRHLPIFDLLRRTGPERLMLVDEFAQTKEPDREWLDDQVVYRRIFSGDTIGIPNIESPHLINVLQTMAYQGRYLGLRQLADALALARPAGAARERYFNKRRRETTPLKDYPEIQEILEDRNYAVYLQEDVVNLALRVAGLSQKEADKLRKMMGEKDVSKEEKERLLQNLEVHLRERGYSEVVVKDLSDQIANFTSYGFLEGHAYALAHLSYVMAYMAEYHPREFAAAVLYTVVDNGENRVYTPQAYINDAFRHGVSFYFPSNLPDKTTVWRDGKVVLGKHLFQLVKKDKNFAQTYAGFRSMYSAWKRGKETTEDLVKYQLEHFGLSFTHNPAILIPKERKFAPERDRQEIIAVQINRTKPYKDSEMHFITFDGGEERDKVFNAILPFAIRDDLRRKDTWHMIIERDVKRGGWNIVRVFED